LTEIFLKLNGKPFPLRN